MWNNEKELNIKESLSKLLGSNPVNTQFNSMAIVLIGGMGDNGLFITQKLLEIVREYDKKYKDLLS